MANFCKNWIRIDGTKEEVKKFVDLVGDLFDFDRVIPTNTETRKEAFEKWGCQSISIDVIYDGDYLESGIAEWEFYTHWRPPGKVYKKLREMFPDLYIYWRYEEPGYDLYGYLQNDDKEN